MGQSISELYGGASVIGPSQNATIADVAVAVTIQLVPIPTNGIDPFIPGVFTVYSLLSTDTIFFKQGGASITPATSSDLPLVPGTFWRVDVDDPSKAFISVLSPAGTGNVLRATRVDSVNAAGVP